MAKRIVIMAGGTGGHVFPALAVASELRQRGVEVSWLGTKNGLEADVIPKAGIEIDWITISGLRGKGVAGWLKAPLRILHAISQAKAVLQQRKPNAVLGMGGFVTGPGGVAARLMGIPLLVHEQNSIPGMTNKLLSRIASKVMEAFPGSLKRDGVINTGNPLRKAICEVAAPAARLASRHEKLKVLVIGGSLGAIALNDAMPQAIKMFADNERPEVWHQTGKKNLQSAVDAYASAGVAARVVAFIEEMADAYAWADLVVCRAGALTISELAAVGVGSILIPYPHAVDDHQTTNAQFLVRANAAILLPQTQLTAQSLFDAMAPLLKNRLALLAMAEAARQCARPNATRDVADLCSEAIHV